MKWINKESESPGAITDSGSSVGTDWNLINNFLDQRDDFLLKKYLDSCKVRIISIIDEKGFTLLHHATLKCRAGKIQFLLYYAREKQKETEESINMWINFQSFKDKFTALHFASFKGCIPVIKLLIQNGANLNCVNTFGLDVLHVAAQGDAGASIYYFVNVCKKDINSSDFRKSTPLHWACYSSSEVAISYILSQNPSINEQDMDNLTPLHLAVKTADQMNSTRMVRYLLMRGARIDITDNKNMKPIDYLQEVKLVDLRNQLQSLLRETNRLGYLNVKAPKTQVKRNNKMVLLYVLLNIYVFTILIIFTFVQFIDLLETFEASQLCSDCKVIRTTRSRHCVICNLCVERFDHHCPWINNCIGIGNHFYFLLYVLFQEVLTVFILVYTMLVVLRGVDQYNDEQEYETHIFYFGDFQFMKALFYLFNINIIVITIGFALPVTQDNQREIWQKQKISIRNLVQDSKLRSKNSQQWEAKLVLCKKAQQLIDWRKTLIAQLEYLRRRK
ncbi:dhhc zinc finger domain containing protein [Stylonychia lemnae]|uniref:Palmitoyltransferase n=1 Tax=Stylonychia lemnae TaxID=5949 RepID=A0A078AQ83_STYLE|nr:dhhc zinc finger domain containing protein [Stylonychia lemnae]|eukprot:CDW84555.1 dhhc zinc finger domain containing protein [Stylonychia lemnae]